MQDLLNYHITLQHTDLLKWEIIILVWKEATAIKCRNSAHKLYELSNGKLFEKC